MSFGTGALCHCWPYHSLSSSLLDMKAYFFSFLSLFSLYLPKVCQLASSYNSVSLLLLMALGLGQILKSYLESKQPERPGDWYSATSPGVLYSDS